MPSQESEGRIIRFGTFEADLNESRLTKGGVRIRLQEQPFQILALLLERPGQLVTREEIRQKLWSSDTFVEFDDALNTAVRKLRTALSDSADNPRFLETVPRRGYRFVAPVSLPMAQFGIPALLVAASAEGSIPTSSELPSIEALASKSSSKSARRRLFLLACGVALVIAASIGVYRYIHRSTFRISPADTVVLADFVNTTGEAVFDDALRQGLEVGLAQSPSVQLLSDRKASVILKQMGHSPDERMTGRIALDVCRRTGGKVTVQGSIASLGSIYLIGLAAIRCDNGEPIANEQVEARRKEDVVDALGKATTQLRARLGESLPSIQKFNAPLEQATTPSLDALNAYGLALSTWDKKGDRPALAILQRALDLDANFAMAYGAMATINHNLGEDELARKNATKAYELKDRVTEVERAAIETRYHQYVTGDLEKAAQIHEVWEQNYPERAGIPNHLAPIYAQLGRYDDAVTELHRAIHLDPTRATAYGNLAQDLLALNRVDEAAAVLREAGAKGFQTDFLLQANYWRAFVQGDTAEMQRILVHSADVPGAQSLLLSEQARTEAYFGHFQKARDLTRVASDLMMHDGDKESAASCLIDAAVREAEVGSFAKARGYLAQARKLSAGRDVMIPATLVMARIGDSKQAQELAIQLDKTYPQDTFVQKYWLPVIRAALDLQEKKPSGAVEALESAKGLEMAGSTLFALYPAYIRGQAYLETGNATKAAAEFQKVIDHPGIVLNFELGALARLGRARAFASAGDFARARDAYQDFLKLWNDADSDLPILKEARAAYSKLQKPLNN